MEVWESYVLEVIAVVRQNLFLACILSLLFSTPGAAQQPLPLLEGTVTDEAGLSIQGVLIQGLQEGGLYTVGSTTSSGRFNLRPRVRGRVMVRVAAMGYEPQHRYWTDANIREAFILKPKAVAPLQVQITDAAGKPWPQARVVLQFPPPEPQVSSEASALWASFARAASAENPLLPSITATTDSEGLARFGDVNTGTVRLDILADPDVGWFTRTAIVEEAGANLKITAGRAAAIRGQISNIPDGIQPAGMVILQAADQANLESYIMTISPHGEFRTLEDQDPPPPPPAAGESANPAPSIGRAATYSTGYLPEGAYTASVHLEGLPALRHEITLKPGINNVEVPVPEFGELLIGVAGDLDPETSRIIIHDGRDTRTAAFRRTATGIEARLRHARPGEKRVFFWNPDAGWAEGSATIQASEAASLQLRLQKGSTLAGRLLLPEGADPEAPEFQLPLLITAHADNLRVLHARVEPDGQFRFTNLPPGKWRLGATSGKNGLSYSTEVTLSGDQSVAVNLEPGPMGR